MDKLVYERKYAENGCKYIAGVDEVGRGPLAGPVVCCAVVMPLDELIDGVDDSKKVPEKKRERLAEEIKNKAVSYCVAEVSEGEIDELNILNAVKKCMQKAVEGLSVKPDVVLVDGLDLHFDFPAEYIVGGDRESYSIGAASIVAKVYRDKKMCDYAEIYPEYGFEKHKGYGTKQHIEAIKERGACAIHRRTFIKNFTEK
ncbi:MAG: ribonuclease HII [Bacillota bacterium]|nr:MAG: ribonuclease HII [Bacillota bacterium]